MTPSSMVPQAHEERTHSTMMAWRVHEFGPPAIMKFERVPRPEPGPSQASIWRRSLASSMVESSKHAWGQFYP